MNFTGCKLRVFSCKSGQVSRFAILLVTADRFYQGYYCPSGAVSSGASECTALFHRLR